QHAGKVFARLDRLDRIELRLDGREARLVDRGGVHVGRVVIGDLARVAAGGRIAGARVPDQVGVVLFGDLEDVLERAGAGTVGGNLRGLQPIAIRVFEEVVPRLH